MPLTNRQFKGNWTDINFSLSTLYTIPLRQCSTRSLRIQPVSVLKTLPAINPVESPSSRSFVSAVPSETSSSYSFFSGTFMVHAFYPDLQLSWISCKNSSQLLARCNIRVPHPRFCCICAGSTMHRKTLYSPLEPHHSKGRNEASILLAEIGAEILDTLWPIITYDLVPSIYRQIFSLPGIYETYVL